MLAEPDHAALPHVALTAPAATEAPARRAHVRLHLFSVRDGSGQQIGAAMIGIDGNVQLEAARIAPPTHNALFHRHSHTNANDSCRGELEALAGELEALAAELEDLAAELEDLRCRRSNGGTSSRGGTSSAGICAR